MPRNIITTVNTSYRQTHIRQHLHTFICMYIYRVSKILGQTSGVPHTRTRKKVHVNTYLQTLHFLGTAQQENTASRLVITSISVLPQN